MHLCTWLVWNHPGQAARQPLRSDPLPADRASRGVEGMGVSGDTAVSGSHVSWSFRELHKIQGVKAEPGVFRSGQAFSTVRCLTEGQLARLCPGVPRATLAPQGRTPTPAAGAEKIPGCVMSPPQSATAEGREERPAPTRAAASRRPAQTLSQPSAGSAAGGRKGPRTSPPLVAPALASWQGDNKHFSKLPKWQENLSRAHLCPAQGSPKGRAHPWPGAAWHAFCRDFYSTFAVFLLKNPVED